ncbi:hypothetical protein [Xanthomarina sp. F2636L]|uniref:hypothetical protein n=1 Tax=Xanthomarina sp. F2636L TaxID=2996018 RepID=UPI00225DFFB5|nr:hypothetical protein [Xanthomarina sp. F2636L]MCX7549679.1 hypothetical protein [Xanthomarina sp. F2636L]
MKRWILFIILIISTKLFAQDPMIQSPDRSLNDEVVALTKAYNMELALSSEQIGLFEIKLEEFLIRRQKIEARLEGVEKLETLYKMQAHETSEMQDILTSYQFEVYKKIKPRIQPIDKVEASGTSKNTKD